MAGSIWLPLFSLGVRAVSLPVSWGRGVAVSVKLHMDQAVTVYREPRARRAKPRLSRSVFGPWEGQ